MTKKKVLLGMSGGVDSSVAAYLLKKEGYDVVGVNMKLWDRPDEKDVEDAISVCEKLDIPFHVIDLQKEFKSKVIENFIKEYEAGHTPNPCVFCNKNIKFGDLFKKAEELGCDYIATGNYALIEYNEEKGIYELKKASNSNKDQTYVMYNLSQEKLSKILFPIGKYNKDQIREMAKEIGLKVYNKPDSQDICFIPDNNYERFLKERLIYGSMKEYLLTRTAISWVTTRV